MQLRLPAVVSAAALSLCVPLPLAAQTSATPPGNTPPAQTAPQPKAPEPSPPATAILTGTVVCNDTRLPARGAVVIAQPIPKNGRAEPSFSGGTSRVGMDGTYTIRHVSPGDYTVIALLPGYVSPYDDLSVDGSMNDDATRARLINNGVVSARNDATSRFDITLQRGATISGHILYDDGAPASQVVLDLEDINAKPAAKKPVESDDDGLGGASAGSVVRGMLLHQNQTTDDQGNFRISGIKPGTYRIAATPPLPADSPDFDFFTLMLGGFAKPGSLRIYSGDTFHKKAAKTYDLHAGDIVSDIDITVPVYAFHRIQGHITSLDDHPIISAGVTLTDASDDSFVLHARPDRDGEFIFPDVPAGTYNLAVTAAKSGTLPNEFNSVPLAQIPLQNVQTFADKTTTLLVKDDDLTDLSIQLQPAPPTPNQPATTPPAAATSPDPD